MANQSYAIARNYLAVFVELTVYIHCSGRVAIYMPCILFHTKLFSVGNNTLWPITLLILSSIIFRDYKHSTFGDGIN